MKKNLLAVACLAVLAALTTPHLHAQNTPAASASPAALDFGDFTSLTLTTKSWAALEAKNYDAAIGYTGKCIDMYKDKAVDMQKALTAPLTGDKDVVAAQWALNDVGTCCFIQGKAYEAQGKTKEAIDSYKFVAAKLPFAQCWDPKGWFWKPADAAKERLVALSLEDLK